MSEHEFPTGGDKGTSDQMDPGAGMAGVMPAKVTDNEDDEKLGRVKVSYPWRDADDDSHWARIAVPLTGSEYGTWFLPEKDDEVLVAFEQGNIHQPYVVGMLWTGNTKPPKDNSDGKNKFRTIVSRAGHKVEFEDSDDAPKITIETDGGRLIEMTDESGSEAITIDDGSNTVELDKSGGEVSISGQQKISLEAPKIEMKADNKISGSAKSKVEFEGKGEVSISSKGKLTLESSGLGKLEASGPLQVKGAIVQIN